MQYKMFYGLMFLLCGLLITNTSQSQIRKLYVHPKTVAKEKQAKFVDSIRFIPLEIKDGITLATNYNINITTNNILLIDFWNDVVHIYSGDGKFLKLINYKKLGDNFYPAYDERTNQLTFFGNNKNYSLTPKDKIKIKLDWNNRRNRKYFSKYTVSLNDSSYTLRKEVPDEKDIVQVRPFFDDYFIQGSISVSELYKDSVDHELKLYKNNELVKSYFPFNRISEPRFLFTQENISYNKEEREDVHFITRPFSDTVYKMIKDSLFPAFKLVLPLENTLPQSFFTKPFKNKTERDNFYRNNGWMLRQVQGFYETPNFIYFMIGYLSNFDSYIYEKKTDIIYKTKNIKADSTQFGLELFSTSGLMRQGDRFYTPQKASDLLTFFDQNKNIPVPVEIEEFIKSQPPAITPVIVEFKLKN